jgi:hypothetical protein
MFWVRWRKLWMISWLLWRRNKLNAKEQKFLREIREDLRTRRHKLSWKQDGWLYGLYDRKQRRRR